MASFQSFYITLMRYLCLFVLGSHQKRTKTAAEQQFPHRSDLFMHLFTYFFWLAPAVLSTCLDIIRVCLTAEAVFIDKHSNLQCYKGRDVDPQSCLWSFVFAPCRHVRTFGSKFILTASPRSLGAFYLKKKSFFQNGNCFRVLSMYFCISFKMKKIDWYSATVKLENILPRAAQAACELNINCKW